MPREMLNEIQGTAAIPPLVVVSWYGYGTPTAPLVRAHIDDDRNRVVQVERSHRPGACLIEEQAAIRFVTKSFGVDPVDRAEQPQVLSSALLVGLFAHGTDQVVDR